MEIFWEVWNSFLLKNPSVSSPKFSAISHKNISRMQCSGNQVRGGSAVQDELKSQMSKLQHETVSGHLEHLTSTKVGHDDHERTYIYIYINNM